MSGPIVRTGTTPKFWENWDKVFGGDVKTGGGTKKSPVKKKAAKEKSPKAKTKSKPKAAKKKK